MKKDRQLRSILFFLKVNHLTNQKNRPDLMFYDSILFNFIRIIYVTVNTFLLAEK